MKSILFILPYIPKIGGVEACLFQASKKLNCDVIIFVIQKFSFYKLKTLKKIKFREGFSRYYNFLGYFYWQSGLIAPLLYIFKTDKKILFINSSIKFRNFKLLFFFISLFISDKVIFDSNNSFKSYSYIKKFPFRKTHTIVPFINDLEIVDGSKFNNKKIFPFIMVMRWHKDKGINNLMDFSKKLNRKIIMFTYPIPDNYKQIENIIFKDGRNRKEVIRGFNHSKVHISLSPREGFSLVSYEAIRCNCVPLSLAKTELSKLIDIYFKKEINSIDEIVSTAIEISNFSEDKFYDLIGYLNKSVQNIPFFYKSIEKLMNE